MMHICKENLKLCIFTDAYSASPVILKCNQ